MNRKNRHQAGIACNSCPVNQLCIPDNLPPDIISAVNSLIINLQVLKPSEHLYHANERIRNLYAVYEGACKDYSIDYEGNETINEFYFPGDIIGLEYLHGRISDLNAVALKETKVCIIPINEIMELSKNYPELQKSLLNLLCKKIYNSNQFQLTTSAKKRVAAFYINYINRMQERNHINNIPLYVSQIDISNKLGLANETFNRILHGFIEAGMININKNTIETFDIDALQDLCTGAALAENEN